jgi:hypothetical protein
MNDRLQSSKTEAYVINDGNKEMFLKTCPLMEMITLRSDLLEVSEME